MNERLKEFAAQAGFMVGYNADAQLEHFAELVRDDEREACAKERCDAEEEAKRNERYIKEMEQPIAKQSGVMSITVSKIETQLKADIDLLWQVNSADIEALEDAKATLQILKKSAPIEFDDMIDETLMLIGKALSMNHGDSMVRVAAAAIRAKGNHEQD